MRRCCSSAKSYVARSQRASSGSVSADHNAACPRSTTFSSALRMSRLPRASVRRPRPSPLFLLVFPLARHRAIELPKLLIRERAVELLAQRLQRLGTRGATRATGDDEPKRTIEDGELLVHHGARDFFRQGQARHSASAA